MRSIPGYRGLILFLFRKTHFAAHWIAGWLGVITLAGCFPSLPKDLFSLEPLDACPNWKKAELEAKARHFSHQTDLNTLRCALGQLRSMMLSDIHKTPIATKLSFLLAIRFTNDPRSQARLAEEGVRWAEIAQPDGSPPNGEIQYYYAVNQWMLIRNHIALITKRRSSMIKALAVASVQGPQVDQGGPLRLLGVLNLVAPRRSHSMGDMFKGLELLKEAVEQYPMHPQNHFYYAKALWETEQDAARAEIQKHLQQTELLLAQKEYSEIADQWRKELQQFVDEMKISTNEPPPASAAPSARRER